MPVPDNTQLEIANALTALLDREDTDARVMELIKRADQFCNEGHSDQAFQCCREAQRLAQDTGDQLAQGVACFHLGLHYFVFHTEEFNRATNLCEQAAQIFHNALRPRAEGIAWLAVGQIAKYACSRGQDRWHRAMTALLKAALILDVVESDLGKKAGELYKELVEEYRQPHPDQSRSASESAAPRPSFFRERAEEERSSSRHFVVEPEETSHSISAPISLKWIIVIAFLIALFIILVFVIAAIGLESSFLYDVGFVLGFVGSMLWTVSVLGANGHLVCRVPADAHAVLQYRNGSLSVAKEGTQLLFPTVERVCAFVPATRL